MTPNTASTMLGASGFQQLFKLLGEFFAMDVGGNPTVVFDSIRNQLVLHFNRGMTDPQNGGSYDCIPAVDNFQITTQDDGLTWSDVKNISSFLEGYLN